MVWYLLKLTQAYLFHKNPKVMNLTLGGFNNLEMDGVDKEE
jgi:hypothetical protein